jgi:hypothetical protein
VDRGSRKEWSEACKDEIPSFPEPWYVYPAESVHTNAALHEPDNLPEWANLRSAVALAIKHEMKEKWLVAAAENRERSEACLSASPLAVLSWLRFCQERALISQISRSRREYLGRL